MSALLAAVVAAVVLWLTTLGLFVAAIWTQGMDHAEHTLSDKLGNTGLVAFMLASATSCLVGWLLERRAT